MPGELALEVVDGSEGKDKCAHGKPASVVSWLALIAHCAVQ